jgi:hypothetical protein
MLSGYNPAMRKILWAAALVLASCGADTPAPAAAAAAPQAAPPAEKIKLEDAKGAVVLALKARDDGYNVYAGADAKVGEVKVQEDRVKLKDAKDLETWKVKLKDYGAEVESPQGQRLFRIRKDGEDWKLEDAGKNVLAKAKKKDDGWELRDAQGKTIAKAKPRGGKVALEAEDGTRLRTLDGDADPRAAMWLMMEPFSPGERAALWAFFRRVWK